MSQFRIGAPVKSAQYEELVLHTEAMAGVTEEMAARVHLLRDELTRLWSQLAQQGGER
jgi:uncharacterized small protein (DUF1192 family)